MLILGKTLLSLMFFFSVFTNLSGGFKDSVNRVESVYFPFPTAAVIIGMIIKLLGSISLVTGFMKELLLPILIIFLILVTIIFNNPLKYKNKLWMFLSLLGNIGGLIICYSIE